MSLTERATVLSLMGVRVTVLGSGRQPGLRITGQPDGLWSVPGTEYAAGETTA